ncbi:MAG: hypothetical protein GC154_02025 [bacterium]|nr:hypothetical protein [bacterium]
MRNRIYTALVVLLLALVAFPAWAQLDESKLTWKPDRGVSLNGYSDYYEAASSTDFDVFQITVEAWVKFRDNGGQQQIIGRGPAAQFFTHYANNGNYRFLIENAGVDYGVAETPVPPADEWVHIAGSYDESTIRLYYNGVLVAETEYPGVMNAGDASIIIGALAPGQRHLNGLFENVRIWNKSLSQEEIDQLLATSPDQENITEMKNNGLVAYWSSRAMSNGVLTDLAGDHNATLKEFTLDESELTFKPQGGISFDGKSTYIKIEDVTDFNVPAFSTEVWVYFDDTHQNQVFMNRGGAPADFTFYLYDRVRFLTQDQSSYSHANGIVPPAKSWVHIVGTLSEDGTKRLYYNGVLQHEIQSAPNPPNNNDTLYLGALEPGSRHLDGQMENMRFWGKALSQEEILALLQTPPDQEDVSAMVNNGLIAYWALRSVDGTTVKDLSGNGHDGEMSAFEIDKSHITFTPDAGIHFDGDNIYAYHEDSAPFENDFVTVEAWVKLAPIFQLVDLGNRSIVSWGALGDSFSLYGSNNYGNRLHFQIGPFGDAAAPIPPSDEWIHVAGTYDENTLNLYYNGVLVDSVNAPGIIDWPVSPLFIGSFSPDSGYFEGSMDYVRVWNRALTESEIQQMLSVAPADENIAEMAQNGLIAYYASSAATTDLLTDLSGNGVDAILSGYSPVANWSLY